MDWGPLDTRERRQGVAIRRRSSGSESALGGREIPIARNAPVTPAVEDGIMARDLSRPLDPTALLIVRAVVERGSALPLRAYIQETSDVSRGFERLSTVTDVETAVGIVRAWLEDVIEAGALDDVVTAPEP